ncbi:unnamed protein product [Adineta steineri]|uniref:Ensconsin-like n=1 Tax=Adineta steineri TaxID=433720 RepID=A0A814NV47_9BILA|nr:unnamed protein product [Adineta steineri]
MSQDSLITNEQDNNNNNKQIEQPSSITTTVNSRMNGNRSNNLDEHIKLVKQKKEEAEVLRLQKFQEQLQKKEQKWQQQQLEKVKKWLQLRNRDTDHRSQVEERRKKREEEAKAKIDEILRREREREQRTNSQITGNLRGNASHKPDSLMSLSTDVLLTRRAISAPRTRSKQQIMANRRKSNDSPITTSSEEAADHSATAVNSHQLNPVDGHRYHRSRHTHDVTITNEDNSVSGTTPRSAAHSRSRPVPASYTFWLNTGDNNNNNSNAGFMRSTYAATCRSRLSRSAERCPRACRAREELLNNPTTTATTTTTTGVTTTNGDQQRRVQSVSRQHLNETIRRLSKPKNVVMAQSVHIGAVPTNGISSSHSSHQLRVSNPLVPTNNHLTTSRASSSTRRHVQSRPATSLSHHAPSVNGSRTSLTDESTSEHQPVIRQSSHRNGTHSKPLQSSSSKPPTAISTSRSKPPVKRSAMTNSHSSSTLSSMTTSTTNKQNIRRINGASPSKQKPDSETLSSEQKSELDLLTSELDLLSSEQISDNQILTTDNEKEEEEKLSINGDTHVKEEELNLVDIQSSTPNPPLPSIEPINVDTVIEIINPTVAAPVSKREPQTTDEQEYQRKLNQKIREAQQRLEVERQREEERQRQLELEEYEREQEQIRLVEEQSRAEQERLQRAIEECERENELKRQEEQRLQQQREELERKQAEETERLNRERQERAKKEEEERNERKKRLDLIMRRTRQVSPSPKPEISISTTNIDETNGHDQQPSSIPHSISDNRLPISLSNDNFLNTNNNESTTPEAPKFKSPLIQSLLNKARNTRSTDNLTQSTMTTSQLLIEDPTTTSTSQTNLFDDDDQQDSGINNTPNGHSDSLNLNSYHEHSIETATNPTTTSTSQTNLFDDDDQQDSGINNTPNGHSDSLNLNSYHEHSIETATSFQ